MTAINRPNPIVVLGAQSSDGSEEASRGKGVLGINTWQAERDKPGKKQQALMDAEFDNLEASVKEALDEYLSVDPGASSYFKAVLRGSSDGKDRLRGLLLPDLTFGTAGLRAEMAPGWARMNDATVHLASLGIASYLGSKGTILIGHDARRNSRRFAAIAASAFSAGGFTVELLEEPVPTPIIPYLIRKRIGSERPLEFGVVITASHNPAKDNGYKVYGSNGAQVLLPRHHCRFAVPWISS